jgi:hypothetical protein
MDLARGIKGKNPRTSMPASQPPPPQPQQPQRQQQPKSFKVLGRPAASPAASPVGASTDMGAAAGPGTSAGSFVVNRPKSYQASPHAAASPSSATSVAYPIEQETGYPPTSFVPFGDAGKRSLGEFFVPGRPGRDPRRSSDYSRE